MIDLTGGEVKVVGNSGDIHSFRLNNSEDQEIINADGEYQAEFLNSYKTVSALPVLLDTSEVETGTLMFDIVIHSGFYKIRSMIPRRTLLTIEVESR